MGRKKIVYGYLHPAQERKEQMTLSGTLTAFNADTTRFCAINNPRGGSGDYSTLDPTIISNAAFDFAWSPGFDGVFKNLKITQLNVNPVGKPSTYTLQVNGTATAITVTIPVGNSSATVDNIEVNGIRGDLVSLLVEGNTQSNQVIWSIVYE